MGYNHKSLDIEKIRQAFAESFNHSRTGRAIVIYTGAGGMDVFDEMCEEYLGYKRVYLGAKVPRVLRKLRGGIYKSLTRGYYRRIRM